MSITMLLRRGSYRDLENKGKYPYLWDRNRMRN